MIKPTKSDYQEAKDEGKFYIAIFESRICNGHVLFSFNEFEELCEFNAIDLISIFDVYAEKKITK